MGRHAGVQQRRLPPARVFDAQLVAELQKFCPSLLEEDGDELVIRHAYIERRMVPR